MRYIETVENLLNQKKSLMIACVVKKDGEGPIPVTSRIIIDSEGKKYGTVGGGALEKVVINKCEQLLKERKHDFVDYILDMNATESVGVHVPMLCGGKVSVFYEYIAPKPRLFIFGIGNVGNALLKVMANTGFSVIICDPEIEPEYEHDHYFNNVQEVIEMVDAECYVVITTNSHHTDYMILKGILKRGCQPRYLGMLASTKKIDSIKTKLLEEEGIELRDVFSPIGFGIGASTAEEIAISIAAQLIAYRNGINEIKDLSK